MLTNIFKFIFGARQTHCEDDNDDYSAIINSSKYADSNDNTMQLEKMLSLLNIEKNDNVGHKSLSDDPSYDLKDIKSRVSIDSIICRDSDEVLPGQPAYVPAKFGKLGGRNFKLRAFDIPRKVYSAVKSNDVKLLQLQVNITMNNYVQSFQKLLWIEEAQQALQMRRYDMFDVLLAKEKDLFLLDVPGLAEGRPSLIRGDRLILRSEKRQSYYEGYIHDVREKDILFKLNRHIHETQMDGLRFTVQFLSSRTPFRRCHHGVLQYSEGHSLNEMIFPVCNSENSNQRPLVRFNEMSENEFPCFNSCLNSYQKRAVMNILKAQSRPAPYVLFGPPGTGKTITLVEAILQICAREKDFKLLVCGNSNASADLCARHIKNSGVIPLENMVRLSAFYRMEKLIPPDLEDVSKDMGMIDALTYKDYRIVVTTCIQAGCLYEFKDLFDYVFIDEACHASEPEALIPIGLLNKGGCCVLAGDPYQLGPTCVSLVADKNGLGTSLLERLCRRTVYSRNHSGGSKMDYCERYITKLRICYRCDPRVLSISNKMFYDSDLKFVNKTPKNWLKLMEADHPLIFHPIRGCCRREYTNPSWFNPAEAIRCLAITKRLYHLGLQANQLGIISPYRRQIQKLELMFDSCGLEKCKIATVEEFQGDEREVIIITTVRTKAKRIEFDKKFKLGFLFNPKRFNVSISRAKWLVIVIGDPQILERDPHWTQYMNEAFKVRD